MQYQQTRVQSAEFLRLAVGHMGRQEAALDPASYTLWYEHVAGLNPPLSQILEQRLKTQHSLTDADVAHLYATHIASREAQAVARIHERLKVLMTETSEVISQSGTHATQFGKSLEDQTERLRRPGAADAIHSVLSELMVETHKMSQVSLTMARQLDTRAKEVRTLTERLERAEAAASNDPLTGLLNRRGLEQAYTDIVPQTVGQEGTSLLLLDVDRFKEINDAYGHAVGDQVLRGVAEVLRARIKGADIAARMGGDEFAVLLPETALKGALALAEKIRATLQNARLRKIGSDESIGQVSISVGVAHSTEAISLDALTQQADGALYSAKREGRNRVEAARAVGK
jgi:diguanylate cyclase